MTTADLGLIHDLNTQPSFMDALKAMCIEEANTMVEALRAAARSGDTIQAASIESKISLLEEFDSLVGRYAAKYRDNS